MQLGHHLIKSWAATQSVTALISGEAELCAIVKGAAQTIGMQSLMLDLGVTCSLKIFTDSTSGRAIASRRGPGRVRHIEVSNLWVQSKVQPKDFERSLDTAALQTRSPSALAPHR